MNPVPNKTFIIKIVLPVVILGYFTLRGFFEKVVWGHWYGFPLDDVCIILVGWTILSLVIAKFLRRFAWIWIVPAVCGGLALASFLHYRHNYAVLQRANIRLREDGITLHWGYVYYSRSFGLCVQSFLSGSNGVPAQHVESLIREVFQKDGSELQEINLVDSRR
jgi:hypothetical protein